MTDDNASESEETTEHEETETTETPQTHDSHAECRGRISALEERQTALESALNAAIQFKPDSSPVKRPWTHRGGR